MDRPSVQDIVNELLDSGFSKEDIASKVRVSAYAVRSWALYDVRPHPLVKDVLVSMLEKAKKKAEK